MQTSMAWASGADIRQSPGPTLQMFPKQNFPEGAVIPQVARVASTWGRSSPSSRAGSATPRRVAPPLFFRGEFGSRSDRLPSREGCPKGGVCQVFNSAARSGVRVLPADFQTRRRRPILLLEIFLQHDVGDGRGVQAAAVGFAGFLAFNGDGHGYFRLVRGSETNEPGDVLVSGDLRGPSFARELHMGNTQGLGRGQIG